MPGEISPDHILQIGFGFWASKTLLSAVELELFSRLADGPKTGLELQDAVVEIAPHLGAAGRLNGLLRHLRGLRGQLRHAAHAEQERIFARRADAQHGGVVEPTRASRILIRVPEPARSGTAVAKPVNTAIRLQPPGSWSSRALNISAAYSKWRTRACIGSGAISRRH